MDAGEIVGIVLGGIIFLLLFGWIFWYAYKTKFRPGADWFVENKEFNDAQDDVTDLKFMKKSETYDTTATTTTRTKWDDIV